MAVFRGIESPARLPLSLSRDSIYGILQVQQMLAAFNLLVDPLE